MLRLLEFLRAMEVIRQAETMQNLSQVEQAGSRSANDPARKPLPSKQKEAAK